MNEMEYETAELMSVVLAREFDRDDWGACGAYSPIPMAGFRLARLYHNRNLTWMSGAGGAINSQAPLVTSSSDYRTHEGAEYIMTLEDIVDWELGGWRKLSTFGVVGGIQIDEAGSVNMAYLGEREHYDLRGPGSVGLVFGTSFSEMMFYLHSHSPEILCGEVDFISSPGYTDGRAADVPEHSEGPSFGITPMATMRFDGAMYVDTIHPGYTAEQVAAATGFEIEISDQVTEPPTEEELEILRNEVDPNGVLQEMDIP